MIHVLSTMLLEVLEHKCFDYLFEISNKFFLFFKKMSHPVNQNTIFYVRSIFCLFSFIWIFVIILNKFYKNIACYILLIPFIIFLLGFINSEDTTNTDVEDDIFSVTFLTLGLVVSLPLLALFNKDNANPELNHVIFLAMISILLSYLHIWVGKENRHVFKAIRSCLETFSITLYIFAISIFFIKDIKMF